MSIPPEAIEVGKCYLAETGEIRRVVNCEHGKVAFHTGRRLALKGKWPRRMVTSRDKFAADAVREVHCPARLLPSEVLVI